MLDNLSTFSLAEISVTGTSIGLFLILQFYYLITYRRPLHMARKKRTPSGQSPEGANHQPPVSIILYAKNDSTNLREHLPALLSQEYPEYEVIVVNDGSTDDTEEILKILEKEYKYLYHTYVSPDVRYVSRRKIALTLGIKAAKHDILLFTESTCQPASERWISSMISGYTGKNTDIVLGFCKYGSHKGLEQKLIAYDNLLAGIRFLSYALSGSPYTGKGSNLSYRKELFFRHKGFSQSLNLHAGDDDLFVNETATNENTTVVYSPESLTEMSKIEKFATWKEMKASRAATARYYKGSAISFFRLESLSFFLFIASAIASIVLGLLGNWLVSTLAGVLLLVRFVTKAVIFHKSAHILGQKLSTGSLFILEFIQPIVNTYIHIYRIRRSDKDYTTRLGN